MQCDLGMYWAPTDTPMSARTTNLNEDLGQVQYVFSDKTGTLTQNVMEFKKCVIGGTVYTAAEEAKEGDVLPGTATERWTDLLRLAAAPGADPAIGDFCLGLIACHTVVPERQPDGSVQLSASSPDESALLAAADKIGFHLTGRDVEHIEFSVGGINRVLEVHASNCHAVLCYAMLCYALEVHPANLLLWAFPNRPAPSLIWQVHAINEFTSARKRAPSESRARTLRTARAQPADQELGTLHLALRPREHLSSMAGMSVLVRELPFAKQRTRDNELDIGRHSPSKHPDTKQGLQKVAPARGPRHAPTTTLTIPTATLRPPPLASAPLPSRPRAASSTTSFRHPERRSTASPALARPRPPAAPALAPEQGRPALAGRQRTLPGHHPPAHAAAPRRPAAALSRGVLPSRRPERGDPRVARGRSTLLNHL